MNRFGWLTLSIGLVCSASTIAGVREARADDISSIVAACDKLPGCTHGARDAKGGFSFSVRHSQATGHIYCAKDGSCANVEATDASRDRKKAGMDNLQKFLDIVRSMNPQI